MHELSDLPLFEIRGIASLYNHWLCLPQKGIIRTVAANLHRLYWVHRFCTRLGERAFVYADPIAGNKLPADIRSQQTFPVCKTTLKTFMFRHVSSVSDFIFIIILTIFVRFNPYFMFRSCPFL